MTLLQCINLSKAFDSRTVLDAINLDIKKGEFLCILGQSGSGKTTLLRLIAGFERVEDGEILLGNTIISSRKVHLPTEKRDIGVVFQDHALWPHMTVFDNVAFPLVIKNLPRKAIQERVMKVLRDVSMENFAEHMPHQLSGGEAQRIALARTLIQEPALIVFDEPLASLDALLRYELQGVIKKLHEDKGLTSLYITHDPFEAMRLGHRIAIIEGGKMQQCDTPETIYHRPRTKTVARLLGQGSDLDVTITEDQGETALVQFQGYCFRAIKNPAMIKKTVSVFIRPEHVFITTDTQGILCTVVDCFFWADGLYSVWLETLLPGQFLSMKSPAPLTKGTKIQCAIHGGFVLENSLD